MQMPAGLLYAKVIEAQNVPNMDWLSKTDAYVKLFIAAAATASQKRLGLPCILGMLESSSPC